MLENFSSKAGKYIAVCESIAFDFGHCNVGSEHLLLSFLKLKDNKLSKELLKYDVVFEKAFVKNLGGRLTVHASHDQFEPLESEIFSEFFKDNFYVNELKYFCHCLVNNEKPLLCLPEDSYKTIAVSCAESRSMEKRSEEPISISI